MELKVEDPKLELKIIRGLQLHNKKQDDQNYGLKITKEPIV